MKVTQPPPQEGASDLTLLELSVQKLGNRGRWPALTATILALFFTGVAASVGVHLSRDYYKVAPYHYDSAAYRVQALRAYESLQERGRAAALKQSLGEKDSLDITLRLLLAPGTLLHRYGHLVVLLPLMCTFLGLLIWYVLLRTRSWPLAVAAGFSIFMFPLLYDVFWGIADYWKDNLATWLLAGAAVAWLLSESLLRKRWSFVSGLFLGLLVMQRSVAAVYAAVLFLPLFAWAAYRRLREDEVTVALRRVASLCLPAAIVSVPLAILQWNMLRGYYLVRGYAYAKPSAVARYLLAGLLYETAPTGSGFDGQHFGMSYAPFVMAGLCCLCVIAVPPRRWPVPDFLQAGWLVVGLPVAVACTGAYFHGFFALWTTLLVVCLGVLLPRILAPAKATIFALALMLVTATAASAQFYLAVRISRSRAMAEHPLREIVAQMVTAIAASPQPHRYANFMGGADAPLINQALFENNQRFPSDARSLPFRDAYFDPAEKQLDTDALVRRYLRTLEDPPGAIAIGWCRVGDIPRWPAEPVSSRLTLGLNTYLLESSRWKAVQRIQWLGTGCLNVYQSVADNLSDVAKWKDLSFANPRLAIPVTLAVGPGVRLYDYSSRHAPEEISGEYFQWLPSGPGLHLTVYSDRDRSVTFQAHAVAGPSRREPLRTLVVSTPRGDSLVAFKGEEELRVPLHLKPGLTRIDFSVREAADVSPPSQGDPRELMLLLASPCLVPASR